METITIKVEKNMAKEIDEAMNPNYSTKTEFIRNALRDKLEEIKRDKLIEEFMKFRGKAKKKTTYEENRKTKWEVSKEFEKMLDKRFS